MLDWSVIYKRTIQSDKQAGANIRQARFTNQDYYDYQYAQLQQSQWNLEQAQSNFEQAQQQEQASDQATEELLCQTLDCPSNDINIYCCQGACTDQDC